MQRHSRKGSVGSVFSEHPHVGLEVCQARKSMYNETDLEYRIKSYCNNNRYTNLIPYQLSSIDLWDPFDLFLIF